jgi:hypothetical protein
MPLLRVVGGIQKVAENSREKREGGEVRTQETRMREHESASKILSPLPTLATLRKVLCIVLGAVTPCVTHITDDK